MFYTQNFMHAQFFKTRRAKPLGAGRLVPSIKVRAVSGRKGPTVIVRPAGAIAWIGAAVVAGPPPRRRTARPMAAWQAVYGINRLIISSSRSHYPPHLLPHHHLPNPGENEQPPATRNESVGFRG